MPNIWLPLLPSVQLITPRSLDEGRAGHFLGIAAQPRSIRSGRGARPQLPHRALRSLSIIRSDPWSIAPSQPTRAAHLPARPHATSRASPPRNVGLAVHACGLGRLSACAPACQRAWHSARVLQSRPHARLTPLAGATAHGARRNAGIRSAAAAAAMQFINFLLHLAPRVRKQRSTRRPAHTNTHTRAPNTRFAATTLRAVCLWSPLAAGPLII